MQLTDHDKIAIKTRERNYRSMKRLLEMYAILKPIDYKIHWKP